MNYRKQWTLITLVLALVTPDSHSQQSAYTPPTASANLVSHVAFSSATPIDENYCAQFERCDRENIFNGVAMPDLRKCTPDKNEVNALLRFSDNTVFFQAKLSLDIDGSWKACNDPGRADQCPTWYEWGNLPRPSSYVDPDKYPYIVIPIAGLHKSDTEFRDKTGINKGDLGVVIYKDKMVPVFVADGGPHNKLGEGSSALFKALDEDRCSKWRSDGHCEKYKDFSIPKEVLFFVFPKSKIDGLDPVNALDKIKDEAQKRFNQIK